VCSDNSSQYFTVTVEKASKHIIVKSMNSTPERGRFIVSSSAAMYLKEKKEFFKFHNQNNNLNFNTVISYNHTDISAGSDVCSC